MDRTSLKGDRAMQTNQSEDSEYNKLLVIMNGPFGVVLRDVPGHIHHRNHSNCPDCPDVLVFAADVHDHIYTINGADWSGTDHPLDGVDSSHDGNRYLWDYGLSGGRAFELDHRKFKMDPSCEPHAAICLPFPDRIYPHRNMDIAFRDGTNPGPHFGSVAGALVFEYNNWHDPMVK